MSKTFFFTGEIAPKADADGLYWVQALRKGRWNYPDPDDTENGFELDEDVFREMDKHFNSGEKGGEQVVNLKHSEDEECGWAKKVQLRNADTEFWAGFLPTDPEVKKKLDNGTLKYASSEIDLAWVNPEACAKGDCAPRKVFEGLALTNHPYIKGMAPVQVPINLSDFPKAFKALEEDSAGTARRTCSCGHDKNKGGNMPELEAVQKSVDSLSAKLEEFIKDAGGSKAELSDSQKAFQKSLTDQIAELKSSVSLSQQDLRFKDFKAKLQELAKKRKLTAPVYNKALRLGAFLIRTGNGIILAEKDKPVKITLSEGFKLADGVNEEAMDKLDVIDAVVDMLGNLPDAIASGPEDAARLAEECGPEMDGKTDDQKIEAQVQKMAEADPTGFGKKELIDQYSLAATKLGLNDPDRRTGTPRPKGGK